MVGDATAGPWRGVGRGNLRLRSAGRALLRNTDRGLRLHPRKLTFVALAIAIPFLVLAAWEFANPGYDYWGIDRALYVRRAAAFLSTGTPFAAYQVTGQPYDIGGEIWLYPPTTLLLVIPFVFLPWPLWWLIPLGVFGYALHRWRPSPWLIPVLAAVLQWPRTTGALMTGNTDIWVMAGVTAGLLWGWPFALLLLKPSVAPLMLFGIRRWRELAAGLVAVGLLSVPFLPLWGDYLTAATNARSPGLLYSLPDFPLLVLPVIAYLMRSDKRDVGEARKRDVGRGVVEPGVVEQGPAGPVDVRV